MIGPTLTSKFPACRRMTFASAASWKHYVPNMTSTPTSTPSSTPIPHSVTGMAQDSPRRFRRKSEKGGMKWTDEERNKLWRLKLEQSHLTEAEWYKTFASEFPDRSRSGLDQEYQKMKREDNRRRAQLLSARASHGVVASHHHTSPTTGKRPLDRGQDGIESPASKEPRIERRRSEEISKPGGGTEPDRQNTSNVPQEPTPLHPHPHIVAPPPQPQSIYTPATPGSGPPPQWAAVRSQAPTPNHETQSTPISVSSTGTAEPAPLHQSEPVHPTYHSHPFPPTAQQPDYPRPTGWTPVNGHSTGQMNSKQAQLDTNQANHRGPVVASHDAIDNAGRRQTITHIPPQPLHLPPFPPQNAHPYPDRIGREGFNTPEHRQTPHSIPAPPPPPPQSIPPAPRGSPSAKPIEQNNTAPGENLTEAQCLQGILQLSTRLSQIHSEKEKTENNQPVDTNELKLKIETLESRLDILEGSGGSRLVALEKQMEEMREETQKMREERAQEREKLKRLEEFVERFSQLTAAAMAD
ncbi:uncharacterized protein BDV17DRAFT_250571 [Aspergillus undulatus]|uniref:uncharacterized protein n=1 Tax=Aspergillus undulatus TaxID=1810928 RepID=UPI003CCD6A50